MTKYHKKMTISELLDMVRGGQGKDALLARTEIENTINRLIGIQDNVEFFCHECGGLSVAVEEYEAQATQKANTISELLSSGAITHEQAIGMALGNTEP